MGRHDRQITEVFTEMAPRYAEVVDKELNRFWGWGYQEFVDLVVDNIPTADAAGILDIATGTGSIPLGLLAKGIDERCIHGLDITFAMLDNARKRCDRIGMPRLGNLVCASGMQLPYRQAAFTTIVCGLATHHMQVRELVGECLRVLGEGGFLFIADAGGSIHWRIPGVRLLLRMAAFLYFSINENLGRAWAEAKAVSNVLSPEGWQELLAGFGFECITIERLRSRYFFVPPPLIIRAQKKRRQSG